MRDGESGRVEQASEAREIDRPRIRAAVTELLLALGEDPSREGLLGTPRRVADMYA